MGEGAIVGILLAAGRSRRFGADKLLQSLPDGSCIAEVAAGKLVGTCDRTLALVGPQSSGELCQQLRRAGVEVVVAAAAARGMGATLAAGVRATPQAAGWVIALADMPVIESASIVGVVAALRGGAAIAAPFHRGRCGHPVGFSAQWFAALAGLSGEAGARGVLDAHPECVTRIDVEDPGVLLDVDTADDLARLRRFDAPISLG